MIDERDYMRRPQQRPATTGGGGYAVPILIAICVAAFMAQDMIPGLERAADLNTRALKDGQVWRLVTYIFLHGGIWHLLMNMWGLYIFGSLLEDRMGSQKFMSLFLVSGIAGGLLWAAFNLGSPYGCVGASASLFGVMIAAAMMYPDAMIMLMIPPLPLKLKTFVIVYAGIETFSSFTGAGAQIAHLAHIGGLIGGYLYMRHSFPSDCYGIMSFFTRKIASDGGRASSLRAAASWTMTSAPSNSPAELDRLLDKISAQGINSLTEVEMDTLRQARDNMRKP